jgi:hypothetical protein
VKHDGWLGRCSKEDIPRVASSFESGESFNDQSEPLLLLPTTAKGQDEINFNPSVSFYLSFVFIFPLSMATVKATPETF